MRSELFFSDMLEHAAGTQSILCQVPLVDSRQQADRLPAVFIHQQQWVVALPDAKLRYE